ncbi:MAG: signal recognition particle-docking protein FtsY [Angustibacter sp.]
MDLLTLLIALAVAIAVLAAALATLVRRPGRPPAEDQTDTGSSRADAARDGDADAVDVRSATQPSESVVTAAPAVEHVESEGLLDEPVPSEQPDPVLGRMARLRGRLARSNGALGRGLLQLLSRDAVDEQTWDEVEEILVAADLGVGPTSELMDRLRARVRVDGIRGEESVREVLRTELLALVDPAMDRSLAVGRVVDRPAVVLVVGVNGTGKTTTVGKLARVLVAQDRDVILGAADTFRAAAADQLETWGSRVGVPTVRADRDGADPAAVAFDAVAAAAAAEADVVVIDTAGRLQNKAGLMDELGKVKRVVEKRSPVDEVLLVLDATTGQNGLRQARVFSEVVDVTGIVLTKLDGTAKGGIVVAVQRELGVPVKLVGLGEGPDDLAPFDATEFVDALLA